MKKAQETEHFAVATKPNTPTVGVFPETIGRKPPLDLQQIINLVGLVPPGEILVPLEREFPSTLPGDWPRDFEFRRWAVENDEVTLRRWLNDKLRGLPEAFQSYVTQDRPGWYVFWFFEAIHRYNFVRNAREKLKQIIEATREAQKTNQLPFQLSLTSDSGAVIDSSWILRKEFDELDTALFGEREIDARDIRECPICHQIFLARRVDSVVCDPESRCAKTYSKRRERENKKTREALKTKKKRAQTSERRLKRP